MSMDERYLKEAERELAAFGGELAGPAPAPRGAAALLAFARAAAKGVWRFGPPAAVASLLFACLVGLIATSPRFQQYRSETQPTVLSVPRGGLAVLRFPAPVRMVAANDRDAVVVDLQGSDVDVKPIEEPGTDVALAVRTIDNRLFPILIKIGELGPGPVVRKF